MRRPPRSAAAEGDPRRYKEPSLAHRELERRFFDLGERAGIEKPSTQAPIELPDGSTIIADFLWQDGKLIVETDGHATHGTRRAFERDRRRDRRLTLLGFRVIRFTWLDIRRHPEEVVQTIAALPSRTPRWTR